jgi:hypothetical protein
MVPHRLAAGKKYNNSSQTVDFDGVRMPDYELPDHTGTLRKLSELQGNNPRNEYCRIRHVRIVDYVND